MNVLARAILYFYANLVVVPVHPDSPIIMVVVIIQIAAFELKFLSDHIGFINIDSCF